MRCGGYSENGSFISKVVMFISESLCGDVSWAKLLIFFRLLVRAIIVIVSLIVG
jgi:hypothetical protein